MNFIDFASAHGLLIKNLREGSIQRCHTTGRGSKLNGAYLYMVDWGWVWDWAGESELKYWQHESIITPQQKAEIQVRIQANREEYRKEKKIKNENAARKAKVLLDSCEMATHEYLDRKGFIDLKWSVSYLDELNPLLCVPMYSKGLLVGVQTITNSGEKKFIYGQQTKGAWFRIGTGDRIFLCEGFATGLSLQQILKKLGMNYTIYVCFSAGNMLYLSKYQRKSFVVADNDASGTGQDVAEKSGLPWWCPEVEGFDLNDLVQEVGLFQASQIFKKGIA